MKGNEMTRLTLSLALWLATQAAWGQVDFQSVTTPQQNAQALKQSIAKHPPGKPFAIPNGVYDFGPERVTFPPRVYTGQSREGVILRSEAITIAPGNACTFELPEGGTLENMTIESTCGPLKQSCVVGPSTESDRPRTVILRGLNINGPVFGAYTWQAPDKNILSVSDCTITVARCGIAFGRSSGKDAQMGSVTNCTVILKPELSQYQGAVTNKLYGGSVGVAVRGGVAAINGLRVEGTGGKLGPRLTAVTDWYDGGSQHATTYINNLTTKLVQGDAKEVFDVDFRLSKVFVGGTGSGANGTLLIRPAELSK